MCVRFSIDVSTIITYTRRVACHGRSITTSGQLKISEKSSWLAHRFYHARRNIRGFDWKSHGAWHRSKRSSIFRRSAEQFKAQRSNQSLWLEIRGWSCSLLCRDKSCLSRRSDLKRIRNLWTKSKAILFCARERIPGLHCARVKLSFYERRPR